MSRSLGDSPYLCGFHDPGGERVMLELGVPGWLLFTEELGFDPNNTSGHDYVRYSDTGLGVIVRLNAGYAGVGTLPFERFYDAFARRCANFARNSPGAHIWIVGNEPNHPIEWPGAEWDWGSSPPHPKTPPEGKRGEPITPQKYALCYRKVRSAIHSLPGHEQDLVLVAGIAPWNNLLTYTGNANGDWVVYFADVLKDLAKDSACDGITLHTYTHGSDPALIRSEAMMDPPFAQRRFHFRAYRDFMAAIPAGMRALPVFITETDQGDVPWRNENTGWVQAAYAEIAEWNRANVQKIRSLLLYRWPQVEGDRWGIDGKQGVIEDFRRALSARHMWEVAADSEALLRETIMDLNKQVTGLQAELAQAAKLADEVTPIRKAAEDLVKEAAPLQTQSLRQRLEALEAEAQAIGAAIQDPERIIAELRNQVATLQSQLQQRQSGAIERPAIADMVNKLAKHPTLPPYEKRTRPVSTLVVHHTDTPKTMTVQRLAEYHVFGERKDKDGKLLKAQWPGIGYHFVVAGDGVIYQGQLESTRSYHVGGEPNDFSIGISLIGRFMTRNYDGSERPPEDQVPTPAQLASTAHLVAWLMQEFKVSVDNVKGHRDVWPKATACPGEHWRGGANWHDMLVKRVQVVQEAARGTPGPRQYVDHYMLFWDHGMQWAEVDWRSAQPYMAHFRPTTGFSVEDAMLARHVTIVGGDAGVSGPDEARLRAAGAQVHRLSGASEAETKAMLDDLIAKNTPWPGAPPQAPRVEDPVSSPTGKEVPFGAAIPFAPSVAEEPAIPIPDEWTVPDDWDLRQSVQPGSIGARAPKRVKVEDPVSFGAEALQKR